ncbi:spore coat protein U domain-containing protein [Sphingobium sp. SCG-1]|uniref:spore coat protein U domain-containing protein n=1 Tax=Sphingobium sp. SCG-1 TaxID=2072936 RepID=UPI001CB8ACEA|nr:spore coat protein U domain-containing protein [Sphingobium sp. SCG-1]
MASLTPYILRLIALLIASLSPPAIACQVTTPTAVNIGTYSPSAVKVGNAPLTKTGAGFSCESANVLTLLSGNFLKARVKSDATLVLTSATATDRISYRLFADAAATTELKPGIAAYYMEGTVVNLLNLLGPARLTCPCISGLPAPDL